ncbi:MAG: aspartate aminotransferase family protein [Sedimenticola sp.]
MNLGEILEPYLAGNRLREAYRTCLDPVMFGYWEMMGLNDIRFVDARGNRLLDQHGRAYLDFASGFGTQSLGRNHPAILDTLRQLSELRLASLSQFGIPVLATALAERLLALDGGQFDKVFFTNSGTESVEAALKLAMCATGRRRFVHLRDSFHGLTLGSLGVLGTPALRRRCTLGQEQLEVEPNNLKQLEKAFARHHRELAGVIVEPVLGKSGTVLSGDYLLRIQALCRQHGVLFIVDEIQTGLYRTGPVFAYRTHPVRPDIVVLSKALSAGVVPVGAVLYRDDVYQAAFRKEAHHSLFSGTFKENNVAMAIALTVLEELEKLDLGRKVPQLETTLREAFAENPEVRIQGRGLLLCLYYDGPTSLMHKLIEQAEYNHYMKLIMIRLVKHHRILAYTQSTLHKCIKILPPLLTKEKEIQEFHGAFQECLNHYRGLSAARLAVETKDVLADMKRAGSPIGEITGQDR